MDENQLLLFNLLKPELKKIIKAQKKIMSNFMST
jgi:hypothetical protein